MQQAVSPQIEEYIFKEINNFKYLGTVLSNMYKYDNHEELKKTHHIGEHKCF